MYFPDIATFLSSVPFPVTPDEFIIGGYFSPGDGGGGTFVWVPIPPPPPTITPPDEDLGIIFYHPSDPTALDGYFKRLYSGSINVRGLELLWMLMIPIRLKTYLATLMPRL